MNVAYNKLPYIYDELQKDVDYTVFQNLILNNISKKSKVLEIGCGTGKISKFLKDNNYDVDAFDLSENMIDVCRKKYNNINFYVDDITKFKTTNKYDAIICFMDTINYIINYNDLVKSFKNVYDSLNKNGVFIFDVHQEDNTELFDNYSESQVVNNVNFKWNSQVIDKLMIHNMMFDEISEQHKQYVYSQTEIKSAYNNLFKEIKIISDEYKDYYILKKE